MNTIANIERMLERETDPRKKQVIMNILRRVVTEMEDRAEKVKAK